MKLGMVAVITLLLLAPVLALQGPFASNGKQYYVVTSTDPSEDTGAEVCAKAGMTCVGYTATTPDVCKAVHPNAQTASSVSGDKSVVYCDGAPQTGACAAEQNTCHSCPSCSTGVDCATPIGNLYREMYVECAGSTTCDPEPTSRSVDELVNEVPRINADLKTCPYQLPKTYGLLPSNGAVLVDVVKNDGTHEYFTLTLTSGRVTGLSHGQQACSQRIVVSENDANAVLGASDRGSAFRYLYSQKGIRIQGCTFVRKFVTFFTQPIARMVIKRTLPPPPPAQTAPTAQEGALLCDFYNAPTKKIVTCGAYRAGDTFCANVMGSAQARAVTCEENGLVLCSVPCEAYSTVKLMNRCAFDINRARGTQAPPIGSCPVVAVQQPSGQGRPANCDDTYLPGWTEYAPNKALWDSYSADTDAVCQSRQGTGTPSGCVHAVQLSRGGIPFYLCWYRN